MKPKEKPVFQTRGDVYRDKRPLLTNVGVEIRDGGEGYLTVPPDKGLRSGETYRLELVGGRKCYIYVESNVLANQTTTIHFVM
jgi:hypothetical protein